MSRRPQSGPHFAGSSFRLAAVFVTLLSLMATAAWAGIPQGKTHWKGRYTYSDGRPPVPFTWSLNIHKTELGGNSEEPVTFANIHAKTLTAYMIGTILGDHVSLIKTFDGMADPDIDFDANYSGNFSADGRKLTGTWKAPERKESGTFEAELVSAGE